MTLMMFMGLKPLDASGTAASRDRRDPARCTQTLENRAVP
jgi:hypothetical protein